MITVILRTVILYILLTFGIRAMGKRQIGDMQPNELVITLLISELAAIPLQDTSQPVLLGVLAIFVLIILEISVSVLALKSRGIRRLMNGKSVVIIKNGVIDQTAMKNVRVTVLDLIELLRGQNIFDISTVAFAVLEVDGSLSVLLKASEQPPTVADLQIKKEAALLELPVITDGKIIPDSLIALGLTENDLKVRLGKLKVADVFLMTMDRNKKANIVEMRGKK